MKSTKIAVLTPISHIEGLRELIKTKGEAWFLEEGTKNEARILLIERKIDTIICNPNQQSYIIDEELLIGTNVSLINTCSTGTNHLDVEYLKSKGIKVASLKNDMDLLENLPSTSELALTLTLCLLRKIIPSVLHTKDYKWNYLPFTGRMASELTLGLIGYGRLGKIMHRISKNLFKNIIVYDPFKSCPSSVSFEELLNSSDVISLHVHVKKDTISMINRDSISKMKKNPIIINTSRGEIVDEIAIIQGLENNLISGYGTDVIVDEFGTVENSPVLRAMNNGMNIIVTPHTGGMTKEGQEMAFKYAVNKL
jgi:phosphoglycerate dehydrogenase-like enzyme